MSKGKYKFKVLNQRIKDKLMSLKVHVKACASVCTLYVPYTSLNSSDTTGRKTNATSSNCGKFLKLLIPLYDGDIRIRTPGKLGKTL